MSAGIRYCSFLEATGYGLAGIAYVRGLVNAGVPVHWVPVVSNGDAVLRVQPGESVPFLDTLAEDAALRDLPALIAATARPVECDTVVAHTVPEHWPRLFQPDHRNIGYTTWEADALPPHWLPLLERADGVCVPSSLNAQVFRASGIRVPVHTVPHLYRYAWNEFAPAELSEFREQLGIPESHFVFYTIGQWTPRKALDDLLFAFASAFSADDPVTLVVKTGAKGFGAAPYYPEVAVEGLAESVMETAVERSGHEAPAVCLMPFELNGRGIDLLHEIGDCYVSLAHGEGWSLGAFDAATRGTPVVMTGWGGHADFLGSDWPGAVRGGLTNVPVFPPHRPSLWPPQRWAVANLDHAIEQMRLAVTMPEEWRTAAARIAQDITNRFAEPQVTRGFLAAIRG
ncbi:MAG: glycosyltransferase family 4 protein [Chromatiales bacterium]|nr:glycosyltransferase family 4 protein [Chromatiales bacterium]